MPGPGPSNYNAVAGNSTAQDITNEEAVTGALPTVTGLISSPAASNVALTVRGFINQTADLQQWQNSAGTVLSNVANDGTIQVRTSIQVAASPQYLNASLSVMPNSVSTTGIVVRDLAGQTADLQQWQNSAGTVLTKVLNDGTMYGPVFGAGSTAYIGGALSAVPVNASSTGLVVRGFVSQTADLAQYQNSAGTVLMRISSTGGIIVNAFVANFLGDTAAIPTPYTSSCILNINTAAAGTSGLAIRGVASQTADLQQWQNNAGTVATKVDAQGRLSVPGLASPTLAAGSAAGSTPPAPINAGGATALSDQRGYISFGAGTVPSAGNQVVVTFANAWANTPVVTVTPTNAAAAGLGLYVVGVSTTGFTVATTSAPATSSANTTYAFAYHVIG